MIKHTLKNNLRIIHKKTDSDLFTINISVLVGSNNESEKILGISHFMEHMLFEGTKKRTSEELTAEIEKYGGDINAYTTNEKTNFYIKIHKRHAKKAIEILSDMMLNPKFDEKAIKKEKEVVLGEINMVNDEPRNYQWVLFEKKLFPKPFAYPTYGTKKTVAALTNKDLIAFHKKYYVPNNIIITLVGECKNSTALITKYFDFKNKKRVTTSLKYKVNNKKKIFKEKKKGLSHQYTIIGYQAPIRSSKDSYTLDVIKSILGKGQSGKLFVEIRTKRGLTYDLGIYHHSGPRYGYMAFYVNAKKEKMPLIEKIFFKEIEKLKNIKDKDLNEAKSFLEGQMALKVEDSQEHADLLSLFEEAGDYKGFASYIKNIRKVTKNDIKKAVSKYLNKNYTKVILI